MESFLQVIPSSTSRITHSRASKVTECGMQANIFIDAPTDSEFTNVAQNSVHIVMVPKGQAFKKFQNIDEEEKIVTAISTYLTILEFFETQWGELQFEMEKKFKCVRKKNYPTELHSDIHFYLSATAYYERWFDNVFMHFKKTSTDFTGGQVFFQQGGKAIMIAPDIVQSLSLSRLQLLDVLRKAGYNEDNFVVSIQS